MISHSTGQITTVQLERIRTVLVSTVAVCTVLMIVGGVAFKSRRWTDPDNGTRMGWQDGVHHWAIWAFIGGALILVLVGASWWSDRERAYFVTSIASLVIFGKASSAAGEYRGTLEMSFRGSIYDGQHLAMGLRLVPVAAMAGSIAAILLLVTSCWLMLKARGTSPRSQPLRFRFTR